MKVCFVGENFNDFNRVYNKEIKERISSIFDIKDCLFNKDDILKNKCLDIDVIFSTWGMSILTKEEIKLYLPNVKYIFYAAGSVKTFAKPFLESGVRIFSSWQANAIPVIEYSISQILLANKGFYRNALLSKKDYQYAQKDQSHYLGNYKSNVGILGFGAIGKQVAIELKKHNLNVFVFANNVSKEDEIKHGIINSSLEDIFSKCNVISNHLPNINELTGIINKNLLNLTGKYVTLINTGRGAQIVEEDLINKLKSDETFYAILDVTNPEPPLKENEINKLDNCILTTHIAGSSGLEVCRMSQYMFEEANRILKGEQPLFEIDLNMLNRIA